MSLTWCVQQEASEKQCANDYFRRCETFAEELTYDVLLCSAVLAILRRSFIDTMGVAVTLFVTTPLSRMSDTIVRHALMLFLWKRYR